MAFFTVHLVTYAAINGFLVASWLLTTGSLEKLQDVVDHPSAAGQLGFWPAWPILAWGALLAIHFASAVVFGLSPRRRRRRQRIRRHVERLVPAPAAVPGTRADERRWVTVMFTDIVDSTAHNERVGDEEWAGLLRAHRQALRSCFAARGGSEVGSQGDGFLARFPSPADAVLCAVDIQRALLEQREETGFAPELRVGIHAGEAVEADGDLVGRVVNVAARVASAAGPGEILVTEPVADHVGTRLDLEDRGIRQLKGVPQARHLLAVVWSPEGSERVER